MIIFSLKKKKKAIKRSQTAAGFIFEL